MLLFRHLFDSQVRCFAKRRGAQAALEVHAARSKLRQFSSLRVASFSPEDLLECLMRAAQARLKGLGGRCAKELPTR